MKKICLAATAVAALTAPAFAERYVMITHTQGTDPFWPVVEKGAKDAAAAVGAELEYNFDPSGDMSGLARLIEAAAATQPDGIIVSLPDPDALGGAISDAVDSGIPVITINSGLDASKDVGALMHVGQPEYDAGKAAGERAKAEGVTNGLCLNQEAYNTALVDRCTGYFDAFGAELNQIDVSNDVSQIKTRTAAALQADDTIDGLLAIGPHVCEAAWDAVEEVGADVHLACFDLSPGVINLIEAGHVSFTIVQHLYNTNAGMLPGANIPSGPGFVDASNAAGVKEQAGVNR